MFHIFKRLFQEHLKTLKYSNQENKPLLIIFSGIPLSGKTTLAKKLEEHYKAVRISNDSIRSIIKQLKLDALYSSDDPVQNILKQYRSYFFKRFKPRNKMWIIDASIDRDYVYYLQLAKEKGMPVFVIRLPITKEIFIKRLYVREKNPQNWIKEYPRWVKDFTECTAQVPADITISGQNVKKEDLIEKLDEKIIA